MNNADKSKAKRQYKTPSVKSYGNIQDITLAGPHSLPKGDAGTGHPAKSA